MTGMRSVYAVAASLAVLAATPVAAPSLATADNNTGTGTHQQSINYVIQRGLSQRGVPYVYGGGDVNGPTRGAPPSASTPPSPSATVPGLPALNLPGLPSATPPPAPNAGAPGFDASGLMVYSFAGAGIKLPRTSGQQYAACRKIAPAQARPGDLIFFGPGGSQSVAMYLGNGQMLEATEPAVTVSPVRGATMAPYLGRVIE